MRKLDVLGLFWCQNECIRAAFFSIKFAEIHSNMENTSKKRGRPPKLVSPNECTVELNLVKRKRGRPRKEKDEAAESAK